MYFVLDSEYNIFNLNGKSKINQKGPKVNKSVVNLNERIFNKRENDNVNMSKDLNYRKDKPIKNNNKTYGKCYIILFFDTLIKFDYILFKCNDWWKQMI